MIRYLYDHGLPFTKDLGVDLDDQIARVDVRKPSLIIIDGSSGSGKTTLGVHIGDYVNKKRGHGEVKLELNDHPQIGLGGSDFMKKLALCRDQGLGFCFYDEAGDFAKSGAITSFNAMINRVFEMFRTYKIIVVIAIPNFNIIDNRIFDNEIPRTLIHLENRGEKYNDFRAFSLARMNWIRYWYSKLPSAIRKVQSYNNVIENYCGHSLDLPPERALKLDLLSKKGKSDYLELSQLKADGLLSIEMMAAKTGKTLSYMRERIFDLKIRSVKKFKGMGYYSPEVFERLRQHIEQRDEEIKDRRAVKKFIGKPREDP